ncbi:carbon-nitrogen hydrolase family protein [Chloroflexota bacterium]
MKTYEDKVTVACVNFAPILGDKSATLEKIKQFTIQASDRGANIIIFPETALTGYIFPLEMISSLAETVPGPSTEEMAKLCTQHGVYVVFGLAERDKEDPEVVYNSVAMVGPTGVLGAYQKVHTAGPELLWSQKGKNYPVFETRYGPVGIGVCYDSYCFPEVARSYAVQGVRLFLNATAFFAFPDVPAKDYVDFYLTTLGARVIENHMFIASADLVGAEGELTFIGASAILGPKPGCMNYHIYAGPAGTEEGIVIATLDLASLKDSPLCLSSIIQDRLPETYSYLCNA